MSYPHLTLMHEILVSNTHQQYRHCSFLHLSIQFDYGRIAMYLEQRGLDLQAGYMAEFKSHSIGNLKEFLLSLKETMVVNMQRHVIKVRFT